MPLIKKSGDVFVFTAGKHAGETLDSVARTDRAYLQWARKGDVLENADDASYNALEETMRKFHIPPTKERKKTKRKHKASH